LHGLKALANHLEEKTKGAHVDVSLDSELIVKQMNGEYKIKHQNIVPLAQLVKIATMQFKSVSFTHIPREKNVDADALANEAMDRGS
jgi:ribonuclease HI